MSSVCIPCRKVFNGNLRCSDCGKDLRFAGTCLRTPSRSDDVGWKIVEVMLNAGHYFMKNGAGRCPSTLPELRTWLKKRQLARIERRPGVLWWNDKTGAKKKRKASRLTPRKRKLGLRMANRYRKMMET